MFNYKYMSEEMNLTDDLSELKISNTVLLEIKDGKIKASYTSDEKIRALLKELVKEETKEK